MSNSEPQQQENTTIRIAFSIPPQCPAVRMPMDPEVADRLMKLQKKWAKQKPIVIRRPTEKKE